MSASPCLWSSRAALYRLFVRPAERSRLPAASSRLAAAPSTARHASDWASFTAAFAEKDRKNTSNARSSRPNPPPPRSRPSPQSRPPGPPEATYPRTPPPPPPPSPPAKQLKGRLPQDNEIRDREIMLVGPDGALHGPLRTADVLSRVNVKLETLRVLSPRNPSNAAQPYAVCKIVDKRAERAAEREKRERERAARRKKTKELEVNWGITEHDLAHKTRHMAQFLARGARVEVMLARKKRSKPIGEAQAAEVLAKVREAVAALGGREWKAPEGKLPEGAGKGSATMRLYFELTKEALEAAQARERAGDGGDDLADDED